MGLGRGLLGSDGGLEVLRCQGCVGAGDRKQDGDPIMMTRPLPALPGLSSVMSTEAIVSGGMLGLVSFLKIMQAFPGKCWRQNKR